MTVETASFISQLDTALPASGDAKSEGDNHLRTIKAAVKGSFPNLGASAVTATASDLNAITGATTTGASGFKVVTQATADNSTLAASTALVTAKVTAAGLSAALPGQSGNAGKYVKTDGTNASWAFAGVIQGYQEFLTSGTWIKPADATWVYVEAIGGGASGVNISGQASCGGGGGAFNQATLRAIDLTTSVTVTVGAGGAASPNSSRLAGGASSFGGYLSSPGAPGGVDWAIGNAGGGEVSSGSTARDADGGYSSGAGGYGNAKAGNCVKGGAGGGGAGSGAGVGGTSVSGGNGGAGSTSVSGASGLVPGGGGGSTSGGTFGGAGGAGRVRVWAW